MQADSIQHLADDSMALLKDLLGMQQYFFDTILPVTAVPYWDAV